MNFKPVCNVQGNNIMFVIIERNKWCVKAIKNFIVWNKQISLLTIKQTNILFKIAYF